MAVSRHLRKGIVRKHVHRTFGSVTNGKAPGPRRKHTDIQLARIFRKRKMHKYKNA